jgi:hypothetical protein
MKNKPDLALFGGSYLFNEIKKRTLKSRETIPLIQSITKRCTRSRVIGIMMPNICTLLPEKHTFEEAQQKCTSKN